MSALKRPPARQNAPSTNRQTLNAGAIGRSDGLWTDLDSGSGAWENVPDTVRVAFRSLLGMLEESATHHKMHSALMDDLERVAMTKIDKLEVLTEKLADNLEVFKSAVALVQSGLAERPSTVAVTDLLRMKVDRDVFSALSSRVSEHTSLLDSTRQGVGSAHARVDAAVAEHATFKQEAQNGVIVATRAANEARTAVTTALSALASTAPTPLPARRDELERTVEEVERVKREVASLRAAMEGKADMQAVEGIGCALDDLTSSMNEKADRVSVAAALHKKVSSSKLPDALSPVTARLGDMEARMAGLAGQVESAARQAVEAATHRLSLSSLSSALGGLEERVRVQEGRVGAVREEVQAWKGAAASAGSTDALSLLNVRQEVSELRSEVTTACLRAVSRGDMNAAVAGALEGVEARLRAVGGVQERVLGDVTALQSALTDVRAIASSAKEAACTAIGEATSARASASSAVEQAARAGLQVETRRKERSEARGAGGDVPDRDHALQSEVGRTREDVAALAREVQGLVQLLDVGGYGHEVGGSGGDPFSTAGPVRHSPIQGTVGGGFSSPSLRVGTSTASVALRETVSGLSERMAGMEASSADLRRGVAHARADACEARDALLQHAAAISQLISGQSGTSARLDGIEAQVIVLTASAGAGGSLSPPHGEDRRTRGRSAGSAPPLSGIPPGQSIGASASTRAAAKGRAAVGSHIHAWMSPMAQSAVEKSNRQQNAQAMVAAHAAAALAGFPLGSAWRK